MGFRCSLRLHYRPASLDLTIPSFAFRPAIFRISARSSVLGNVG
ncbi:hypothetical protein LINGRAHAP2_LOCUS31711, partial [Linum grandiflorum]